ncbi:helix-turn-helix domain-containing protein [Lactococcus cremoris]|uniref:XRE family transcriptional regulator n=1 Tax=Lactococcus lactis subsp. cremoris TaxID=1359 RepID=UPI0006175C1B|nr:S24 family peptidase [Lactococcus cremoris]MCT0474112.1 helix-turn-helix domain-containing protein [Lactococcus cremoris]MCT0511478.1 helix-turn-helix domain-containing protein [Lactococcus cremoris]
MKKIRLPEMIDYFRKENSWTMKELGEKLGKSESAISKWIKGVRSPMVEDFDKMVNLFNTDPDTLMYGASDLSTTLSEINKISSQLEEPRQKIVLNTATNQLDEQKQEKKKESKVIPINKIPDDLPPYISRKILENFVMPTNTMEYEPDEDMVDVPILGRIAAGLPLDAVENFDGTRPVPAHFLSSARDYYWLMVDGHSMEPKIPFGSYVLIEAVPDVTDGTIGAVLFQDDCQATLKKVYHEIDCLRLVSINKEFKDQFATQDNPAAVIGQAVKVEIDL